MPELRYQFVGNKDDWQDCLGSEPYYVIYNETENEVVIIADCGCEHVFVRAQFQQLFRPYMPIRRNLPAWF